jgi:hypothetical protein
VNIYKNTSDILTLRELTSKKSKKSNFLVTGTGRQSYIKKQKKILFFQFRPAIRHRQE